MYKACRKPLKWSEIENTFHLGQHASQVCLLTFPTLSATEVITSNYVFTLGGFGQGSSSIDDFIGRSIRIKRIYLKATTNVQGAPFRFRCIIGVTPEPVQYAASSYVPSLAQILRDSTATGLGANNMFSPLNMNNTRTRWKIFFDRIITQSSIAPPKIFQYRKNVNRLVKWDVDETAGTVSSSTLGGYPMNFQWFMFLFSDSDNAGTFFSMNFFLRVMYTDGQ